MMGTGKFDAWKAGEFALEDMPGFTHSDVWGDSWTPKPLYELLGEDAPVGTYAEWVAGQDMGGEWFPSMTREQADEWAKSSVFSDPVYHGTTNQDAMQNIIDNGFDLSRITNGRTQGNGVYAATDREATRRYAPDDNILELRANVENVLEVNYVDVVTIKNRAIDEIGSGVSAADAMTQYLEGQGYDAMHITGLDYLVVFDPKNVTVVR